jgi:hypothetical protein
MDSIYDDKDVMRAIENYHKWKNFLMRDDIFTLLESIDYKTTLNDIKQMTPDECVQDRLSWIITDEKYRDSAIEQAKMVWELIGKDTNL